MKFEGQVAVVTGGASGIGAASAIAFAREGAKVALVDVDTVAMSNVVRVIKDGGGLALAIEADVSSGEQARAGVSKIMTHWGRIDILVTSCAVSTSGTVASIDEAAWDRVFAINVKGCYNWAHYILPIMMAQGSGAVVLVCSQLITSSFGNSAAYIASKGAIATLAKTMAVDHAVNGIRVNALMPGVIDTPMSRASIARQADPNAVSERWRNRHAMRRFGHADEIAKAILFLSSSDSSFTTGSWLFADGGWSAM